MTAHLGTLSAILLTLSTALAGPAFAQDRVAQADPVAPSSPSTEVDLPASDGRVAADSQEVPETFAAAVAAYESGDYVRAVEGFSVLSEALPDNGAILYNLGNSQLRNGQLGQAIATYRRASSILPRDRDLQANLRFARSTTRDALEAPDAGPVLRTLFFWHHYFSLAERVGMAVISGLALWIFLALRLLRRQSSIVLACLAVSLVGFAALFGSLAWTWLLEDQVAVVVPGEIGALTAPRDDAVVRFQVHAGTELEVVERRGEWLRVQLPDGERGWVEQAAVALSP